MSTTPAPAASRHSGWTRPGGAAAGVPVALLGAALAVAVTVIHVLDQGGVTSLREPAYLGYGYWALEVAALVAAALILARRSPGWLLAVGVAAGPLLGYVLSRSVGLPGYSDDVGNWTEPLGLVALAVEGVLLVLALVVLAGSRRPAGAR